MELSIPIPPKEMIFVGEGDFQQIGEKWKRYFVEKTGLSPSAKVLDVGCGIGRMARPLTGYLAGSGEYRGFDVVKEGISWCQQNITSRFPNFKFQLTDVYNKHYNPAGTIRARDYKFPYDSEYFDFVFLTSVFTHMLPDEMENYLREIARVLKKQGTCVATFFLLNGATRQLMQDNKSSVNFKHRITDVCFALDGETPEAALAYDENFVFQVYSKSGLKISRAIQYGEWRRDVKSGFYQDIVCAVPAADRNQATRI